MTAVSPPSSFEVAWSPCIFGDRVGHIEVEHGETVADLVRRLVNDPPAGMPAMPRRTWLHGHVEINGHVVERGYWHVVKPRRGFQPTVVTVQCPFDGGGDDGGAKVFGTLASVALLFATAGIASGGLAALGAGAAFAGGTTGANIAAAGVGLLGSLALQALSPPPVQPRAIVDRPFKAGSISGNVVRPGEALQHVIGERLVYPDLVAPPLAEIVENRLLVEAVYMLEGPHRLNDIRVGGAKIGFIEGITSQTRDGIGSNSAITNVERYGYTEDRREELLGFDLDPEEQTASDWRILTNQTTPAASSPQWVGLQSRPDPDEVWIHLAFPEGLLIAGNLTAVVPLWVEFRELGDTTWVSLPLLAVANWTNGECQFALRFHWVGSEPGAGPTPPPDHGFIGAHLDPSGGWTPSNYFDDGAGADYLDATSGATRVRRIHLYRDKAIVYLLTSQFPKGTYEFRIKRGCSYQKTEYTFSTQTHTIEGAVDLFAYENNGGVYECPVDQVETYQKSYVSTIASVKNEHPCPLAPTYRDAVIAIKAGRGIQVDKLSVVAAAYVPDWTGSAWIGWGDYSNWSVTSNPAAHLRWLLQSDRAVQPLADASVDSTGIVSWRSHCTSLGLECNTVLGPGTSAWDALQLVAQAGNARTRQSNVWGVIVDKDVTGNAPVQLFTPRQFRNFSISNPLPDRPHALICNFVNRDRNWSKDVTTVYDDGRNAGNSSVFEVADYVTDVDQAAVETRAARNLAEARLRGRIVSFEVRGDGVRCQNGSLVAVSHDIMLRQAGRARVKSVIVSGGMVYGLRVDDYLPTELVAKIADDPDIGFDATFDTDGRYTTLGSSWPSDNFGTVEPMRAMIKLKDGTFLTKDVEIGGDDHRRVDFVTPFADPGAILGADCVVATGLVAEGAAERMIVLGMTPTPGFGWKLECVDEAPAINA